MKNRLVAGQKHERLAVKTRLMPASGMPGKNMRGCAVGSAGIYLSIEAVFSMLVLVMLLAVPLSAQKPNLERVYLMQKENDLLAAWARERQQDGNEIASDFMFVFPGKSGEVEMDRGKPITIGEPGRAGEKSVVSGHYVDGGIRLVRIKLTVYY